MRSFTYSTEAWCDLFHPLLTGNSLVAASTERLLATTAERPTCWYSDRYTLLTSQLDETPEKVPAPHFKAHRNLQSSNVSERKQPSSSQIPPTATTQPRHQVRDRQLAATSDHTLLPFSFRAPVLSRSSSLDIGGEEESALVS
jgi:hypothetical protein